MAVKRFEAKFSIKIDEQNIRNLKMVETANGNHRFDLETKTKVVHHNILLFVINLIRGVYTIEALEQMLH